MKKRTRLKEGTVISQCPECHDLAVAYAGGYGNRPVPSVVLFGEKVRKALCMRCVARFQI